MGAQAQMKRGREARPDDSARSLLQRPDGPALLRRCYLDALPIAAAIVTLQDGAPALIDANDAFLALNVNLDPEAAAAKYGYCPLVEFLTGEEQSREFGWSDGDPLTGREYRVRMARLIALDTDEPRCLLTMIDLSAERAAEKSLRLEMFNDSLTGLPNRAGFGETLERAIEGAEAGGIAVLAVDLMRFSRINESIGAVSGDELLITVARRLLSALRGDDVLARIGGDEFALLVHIRDGAEEALAVAERIHSVLAAPCRLSDFQIRIDCAIGCALLEKGCDGDELVRRAQFALKRAKSSGATEIYQPLAFDMARRQFTIETSLRHAIESERLSLAFQPVIELQSGRICGFEALARWRDGDAEIPPSTFIPVAEESGLILPLGRWALDKTMRTLGAWDSRAGAPVPVRMAVNVSALQIARDDVPAMLSEAAAANSIPAERIVLELTESAIVADPDRAARAMEAIRAIGATIALDDFGTGYSNLAYLQRLPIDVLKIDQSFVTGMLGNRDKVAIVRAILSLADALGLKTTAEGVETLELAQTLAALGCTRAQGYFYAPPLDADEAFDFWRRSSSPAT
jgi:diguanylate cyclase (GGDEF)-like protein